MIDSNKAEKNLSTLLKEIYLLNIISLGNLNKIDLNPKNKSSFAQDDFIDLINEGYLEREKGKSNVPYKITSKGINYLEDITSILNFSRYGE